jgi:hypothetical protein
MSALACIAGKFESPVSTVEMEYDDYDTRTFEEKLLGNGVKYCEIHEIPVEEVKKLEWKNKEIAKMLDDAVAKAEKAGEKHITLFVKWWEKTKAGLTNN